MKNTNFYRGIVVGILLVIIFLQGKSLYGKYSDIIDYKENPMFMKVEFADGSTMYANNGHTMSIGWQAFEKHGGKASFELISKEEYNNRFLY